MANFMQVSVTLPELLYLKLIPVILLKDCITIICNNEKSSLFIALNLVWSGDHCDELSMNWY